MIKNTSLLLSQNSLLNLDLSDVTIAGESIGGILPITVSLKIPNRIKKLLCFNPYDYDTKFAEGIRRGNFFCKFYPFHVGLPLIGSFFLCSKINLF